VGDAFGNPVFSIGWAGGTGPHDGVDGFVSLSCEEEEFQGTEVGVVVACSAQEAEAICGGPLSDRYDQYNKKLPGGHEAFFCEGDRLTTGALRGAAPAWSRR
jgi:hypothetical protein